MIEPFIFQGNPEGRTVPGLDGVTGLPGTGWQEGNLPPRPPGIKVLKRLQTLILTSQSSFRGRKGE